MNQSTARLLLFVSFGACAAQIDAAEIKITPAETKLDVSVDGKPFTAYHFAGTQLESGPATRPTDLTDPLVRPYFFPVRAADGTVVTSDELTPGHDGVHPHHRSLWVAQGNVNGADSWSLQAKPRPPRQIHLKFDQVGGDGFAEELEWEGKDYKPVLREKRTVRFLAWDDGCRGVDFTLVFTPVAGDVVLGETKEAGLCAVRVAPGISAHNTLTNSTGAEGEKACWGRPADWADESGQLDGKPYGISILDFPANPRHPATWHQRAYGLLTANIFGGHEFDSKLPKGTGDLTIKAGEPVTFRYRVIIHPGDAKSARIAEKYGQYAGGH